MQVQNPHEKLSQLAEERRRVFAEYEAETARVNAALSQAIIEARDEGMTVQAIADTTGISRQRIYEWMERQTDDPG